MNPGIALSKDDIRAIGKLVDGGKHVLFRETDQETPSLMLKCYIGEIKPFRMQLLTPARFHSPTINRSLDRSTTTIVLKVDEHMPELEICTKRFVCTHIPLPYLASIVGMF